MITADPCGLQQPPVSRWGWRDCRCLAGRVIWPLGAVHCRVGGCLVVLTAAAHLLLLGLRVMPVPRALSVKQALGNLLRPGGTNARRDGRGVGIGVMVILAIGLLEHALVRQVGENRPSIRRPSFLSTFSRIRPLRLLSWFIDEPAMSRRT